MKNYLIIGGSSGIGKQLTDQLVEDGCKVFATYNTKQSQSSGSNLSYHFLDVLQENTELDFIPDILHGLAYCPGAINLRPFSRIKPQVFRDDYELQVIGAIKVIQAVLLQLKSAGTSAIVLFSTVAVQTGFNFHSIVSSSKGAVEGLTKALAAEFAPTIRVNCIAPSVTDTPLAAGLLNTEEKRAASLGRHPLKRIGSPEDIAHAAHFLLTEKSGWITGQVIHIDGGISNLKI